MKERKPINTDIRIKIYDEPYKVPTRKDSDWFFGCKFDYWIPEVEGEEKRRAYVIHFGAEGSHSIKQIHEQFLLILGHLKRQILMKESVKVK